MTFSPLLNLQKITLPSTLRLTNRIISMRVTYRRGILIILLGLILGKICEYLFQKELLASSTLTYVLLGCVAFMCAFGGGVIAKTLYDRNNPFRKLD